jgi:hypothetical protein
MRRRLLAFTAAVSVVGAAGCGGGSSPPARHPTDAATTGGARAEHARTPPRPRHPPIPRCPATATNCRAGSGRVLGLESVDPDGDGDLHLILAGDSITLPGITVLDINKHLRPREDPRVGDWAAGAGPVYSGSYGQHQIQVERVVFDPRRG